MIFLHATRGARAELVVELEPADRCHGQLDRGAVAKKVHEHADAPTFRGRPVDDADETGKRAAFDPHPLARLKAATGTDDAVRAGLLLKKIDNLRLDRSRHLTERNEPFDPRRPHHRMETAVKLDVYEEIAGK